MSTQIADVFNDLLLASLDDTRIRLSPMAQRRLLDRMVELAEVAGLEIVIAATFSPDENQEHGLPDP